MEESVAARMGRYLAGEMDLQEKTGFEQELSSSPEMKQEFLAFQRIWVESGTAPEMSWDQDLAWDRFTKAHTTASAPAPSRRISLAWAIAASLLFLLVSSYFLFVKSYSKTYLYADVSSAPVELNDGTRIYLNKGSAVTVHPFTRKTRHIELNGEAFFQVASDPKRPFIIACGKTITEVVGTSFTLKQGQDEVQLFVTTGKVIFSASDGEDALALTAGEAAIFQNEKMRLIPNPSPNINAWYTRQLLFVNMPLSDVIRDMSEYFGQTILIEDQDIKKCPHTNTLPYKNPEITALLKTIARTINAEVVNENDTFIIKGGSCQ